MSDKTTTAPGWWVAPLRPFFIGRVILNFNIVYGGGGYSRAAALAEAWQITRLMGPETQKGRARWRGP